MVKDVVRSVRNARSEYNVETTRKISATIVAESEAARQGLTEELAVSGGGGAAGDAQC